MSQKPPTMRLFYYVYERDSTLFNHCQASNLNYYKLIIDSDDVEPRNAGYKTILTPL